MNILKLSTLVACSALAAAASADAPAPQHAEHHPGTPGDPPSEFVKTIRKATARFRDVKQAEAEGYMLHFGCVSDEDAGAMGLHYVNMGLVGDGVLDPERPEIVIYEPLPNGRLKLIGADFLVIAEAWHAANPATPELGGQLFHLFEAPNRFGLPPFYTLHVWAWKKNQNGMFVNWHPKVTCDNFSA
jgi:hypothetical protein